MSDTRGYQVLQTEEDPLTPDEVTAEHEATGNNVAPAPNDSPPPYESSGIVIVEPIANFEAPPIYTDVVKLPTYNESESIETEQTDEDSPANQSIFFYWLRNNHEELTDESIGTDTGFIFCFLLTFIFNWIGFITAYCFTTSLSSHYGALSGLGLSLVKWTFIAKHSEWSKDYIAENPWVLYVFVLLGWIVFLRGIFGYAQLKRYVCMRAALENHDSRHGFFG